MSQQKYQVGYHMPYPTKTGQPKQPLSLVHAEVRKKLRGKHNIRFVIIVLLQKYPQNPVSRVQRQM